MALVINDRVKETTTTTGTGTVSLAGAVTGFETFAAGIGNSNTVYYCIAHQDQAEFEVDYRKFEKSNPETSFDINAPFWAPKRKKYIEGYTYLDPSSGKFFRRSSGAAGDPDKQIPVGFEDVSADIKRP